LPSHQTLRAPQSRSLTAPAAGPGRGNQSLYSIS